MILDVETAFYARVKRGTARGGSTHEYVALKVPVEVSSARLADSQMAVAYVKDGRRRELRHMDGRLYERLPQAAGYADDATRLTALAGDCHAGGRWLIGLGSPGHGTGVTSPTEPGLTVHDKDGALRRDEEAKVRAALAKVVLLDGEVWVERREPRYAVHVRTEGHAVIDVTESHGSGEGEFRLDEADAASEYARRVGTGAVPTLPATLEFLEPSFLGPPSHERSLASAARSACHSLGNALAKATLEFMVRYVALRETAEGRPHPVSGRPSDASAVRAALEDVMDELRASDGGWALNKARLALVEMDVAEDFAARARLEADEESSLAFAP